jgi:hypothetical protein
MIIVDAHRGKSTPDLWGRVRVVEPENPLSVSVVQRQRIADSVRYLRRWIARLGLDLDPIATILNQHLAIEVQKVCQWAALNHISW